MSDEWVIGTMLIVCAALHSLILPSTPSLESHCFHCMQVNRIIPQGFCCNSFVVLALDKKSLNLPYQVILWPGAESDARLRQCHIPVGRLYLRFDPFCDDIRMSWILWADNDSETLWILFISILWYRLNCNVSSCLSCNSNKRTLNFSLFFSISLNSCIHFHSLKLARFWGPYLSFHWMKILPDQKFDDCPD